jgi:ElaB/YqjD/DUF883 family membrane-anchored ribosome-binding protein
MTENHISGRVQNVAGKAQPAGARTAGAGRATAEDAANSLTAMAEDVYGEAREGVSGLANAARDAGSSFEGLIRNTIEQQPYKAVAIALGIGWFLGRFHRPL